MMRASKEGAASEPDVVPQPSRTSAAAPTCGGICLPRSVYHCPSRAVSRQRSLFPPLARSFAGDPKQLVALLEGALAHSGTAFLDVISPCVTFNNHEGSTKSYKHAKESEELLHEINFVPFYEQITVDYDELSGEWWLNARRSPGWYRERAERRRDENWRAPRPDVVAR